MHGSRRPSGAGRYPALITRAEENARPVTREVCPQDVAGNRKRYAAGNYWMAIETRWLSPLLPGIMRV